METKVENVLAMFSIAHGRDGYPPKVGNVTAEL
jgi:hypothetical protein